MGITAKIENAANAEIEGASRCIELIGLTRPHVFLEEYHVGNCLEQAEGTGNIRAGPSVCVRSTFNPQGKQNVGESGKR